jgi:hypothetical protein
MAARSQVRAHTGATGAYIPSGNRAAIGDKFSTDAGTVATRDMATVPYSSRNHQDPNAKWTPYFGLPEKDAPRRVYDQYRTEVQNFPEAYDGDNFYLSQVFITFLTNSQQWPIRAMMPVSEDFPGFNVVWDEITFDDAVLTREPEQSTPRFLTSSTTSNRASLQRHGIGALMECGMMGTAKGDMIFRNHIIQMANATIVTMCIGVILTLMNPAYHNITTHETATALFSEKSAREMAKTQFCNSFHAMGKNPSSALVMFYSNERKMVAASGKKGDIWYVPAGSMALMGKQEQFQERPRDEILDPDFPRHWAERKMRCTIMEAVALPQGKGEPMCDPTSSLRRISTFFQMTHMAIRSIPVADLRTQDLNVEIYTEMQDTWYEAIYVHMIRNGGIFYPVDFTGGGGSSSKTKTKTIGFHKKMTDSARPNKRARASTLSLGEDAMPESSSDDNDSGDDDEERDDYMRSRQRGTRAAIPGALTTMGKRLFAGYLTWRDWLVAAKNDLGELVYAHLVHPLKLGPFRADFGKTLSIDNVVIPKEMYEKSLLLNTRVAAHPDDDEDKSKSDDDEEEEEDGEGESKGEADGLDHKHVSSDRTAALVRAKVAAAAANARVTLHKRQVAQLRTELKKAQEDAKRDLDVMRATLAAANTDATRTAARLALEAKQNEAVAVEAAKRGAIAQMEAEIVADRKVVADAAEEEKDAERGEELVFPEEPEGKGEWKATDAAAPGAAEPTPRQAAASGIRAQVVKALLAERDAKKKTTVIYNLWPAKPSSKSGARGATDAFTKMLLDPARMFHVDAWSQSVAKYGNTLRNLACLAQAMTLSTSVLSENSKKAKAFIGRITDEAVGDALTMARSTMLATTGVDVVGFADEDWKWMRGGATRAFAPVWMDEKGDGTLFGFRVDTDASAGAGTYKYGKGDTVAAQLPKLLLIHAWKTPTSNVGVLFAMRALKGKPKLFIEWNGTGDLDISKLCTQTVTDYPEISAGNAPSPAELNPVQWLLIPALRQATIAAQQVMSRSQTASQEHISQLYSAMKTAFTNPAAVALETIAQMKAVAVVDLLTAARKGMLRLIVATSTAGGINNRERAYGRRHPRAVAAGLVAGSTKSTAEIIHENRDLFASCAPELFKHHADSISGIFACRVLRGENGRLTPDQFQVVMAMVEAANTWMLKQEGVRKDRKIPPLVAAMSIELLLARLHMDSSDWNKNVAWRLLSKVTGPGQNAADADLSSKRMYVSRDGTKKAVAATALHLWVEVRTRRKNIRSVAGADDKDAMSAAIAKMYSDDDDNGVEHDISPLILDHSVWGDVWSTTGINTIDPRMVVDAILSCMPIDYQFVQWCLDHNMPPLLNFAGVRSGVYQTGSGIYMRGYGVAGLTFLSENNVMMAPGVARKTFMIHYTVHMKSVLFDSKCVLHNPNMLVTSYVGGNNHDYYNLAESEHLREFRTGELRRDILPLMLGPGEHINDTNFNLTGYEDPSLGGDGDFSKPPCWTNAKIYAEYLGWQHMPSDTIYTFGAPYELSPDVRQATTCFRAIHWTRGESSDRKDGSRFSKMQSEASPWGQNVYPGVGRTRNIENMEPVVDQKYGSSR